MNPFGRRYAFRWACYEFDARREVESTVRAPREVHFWTCLGKMAEQNWYRCLDCWWFFFLPCHSSPVHVHIFKLAIFRKAQNTFCQNRIPNTGSIVQWFPGGFYKTSPCCFLLPWNDTGFSIFFIFVILKMGAWHALQSLQTLFVSCLSQGPQKSHTPTWIMNHGNLRGSPPPQWHPHKK